MWLFIARLHTIHTNETMHFGALKISGVNALQYQHRARIHRSWMIHGLATHYSRFIERINPSATNTNAAACQYDVLSIWVVRYFRLDIGHVWKIVCAMHHRHQLTKNRKNSTATSLACTGIQRRLCTWKIYMRTHIFMYPMFVFFFLRHTMRTLTNGESFTQFVDRIERE